MNKDYEFIKKFTKISISGICKDLNINRCNIMKHRTSSEKYHLVRKELESRIERLLKNE